MNFEKVHQTVEAENQYYSINNAKQLSVEEKQALIQKKR